jgi:hypothetical protein
VAVSPFRGSTFPGSGFLGSALAVIAFACAGPAFSFAAAVSTLAAGFAADAAASPRP